MTKQQIRHSILSGLIIILLVASKGYAKIPEPGNIIFGLLPVDNSMISLQIEGEVITYYTFGDVPAAGQHFILRVPVDTMDPQESGTARPGDEAALFLDAETTPIATVIVGEKGTVHRLFLPGTPVDTDMDGAEDGDDNCPEIANADQRDANNNGLGDACDPADSDGDGYSDMLEYFYLSSVPPHLDLDGNPYDPLQVNRSGDATFNSKSDIDGNMTVDLADVILALQIVTGALPAEITVYISGDVDGDARLSLLEAVYALQKAAGL